MGEWIDAVRYWVARGKELMENAVARWAFIAVLVAIVLLLLMGKSWGGADVLVLEAGGDRIVLEMTPCTSDAKAVFQSDIDTRTATYVIGKAKKTVNGCYAVMDTPQHGKVVSLLFEDGDSYAIPLDKFKPGDASAKRVGLII